MCKTCPACKMEKPLADYFRDNSKASGVGTYCKACDKARSNRWAADNRQRSNEIKKGYVERNPELRKAQALRWKWENIEYHRESARDWGRRNQHRKNASAAQYRANKRMATPVWLTQADHAEINAMYEFCQIFKGFEVDHIIPLVHPQVQGLHVPWNLQVIPATENRRKSNKFAA